MHFKYHYPYGYILFRQKLRMPLLSISYKLNLNLQGLNTGMQTLLVGRDRNYISGLQVPHFLILIEFVQRGETLSH